MARSAIELFRSIACQMWVTMEAPGRLGSLTPSPMNHSPSVSMSYLPPRTRPLKAKVGVTQCRIC